MAKSPVDRKEIDRLLINTVMFDADILPMERTDLDMRRALSQLPAEEAHKLKRKFRKMWRKAMKAEIAGAGPSNRAVPEKMLKQRLGAGKALPSRAERNARKQLVFDSLWKEVIEPVLKKFNDTRNPSP